MYTAGVDVGIKNTKLVILEDSRIIAKGIIPSGGKKRGVAVQSLWAETLSDVGLSAGDMNKVISTGAGKFDVIFADGNVVEEIAAAQVARYIDRNACSVVDIGVDQTRVVTLAEENKIREIVRNQKCMAGLGILLDNTARRLDFTLDELGVLTPDDRGNFFVNDGCPVFAELDSLELLNAGVPREEVARAVLRAVVVRLNSILKDKIVPGQNHTVLIGGIAKNKAVVEALRKRSGIDFIVPEDPEYGCALGAAIMAAATVC